MEENRDIKGLLQEQFAHFEADPGVDLWAGIEAELHAPAPTKRLWVPWVSVAASIALLFGMFWLLKPSETGEAEGIATSSSSMIPMEKGTPTLPSQTESPLAEVEDIAVTSNPSSVSSNQTPNIQKAVATTEVPTKNPFQEKIAKRSIGPINPLAQAAWKNPEANKVTPAPTPNLIPQQDLGKVEKAVLASNKQNKREVIRTKNNLNLNDLTLGQALVFATKELSKLNNSPVEVHEEAVINEEGPSEKMSEYKLDFLNVRFASNEVTKTSAPSEKTLASAEPVEEINTYQFDLFNIRFKKKTHKRVINKSKS